MLLTVNTSVLLILLAIALGELGFANAATDQSEPDEFTARRKQLAKAALADLEKGDSFHTIQMVASHEPLLAVTVFGDLQNHCYWKKRDVQLFTAMGRAGIQLGLIEADKLDATDKQRADQIRAVAKGLAYDVGSFNWPGWGEADLKLGPNDVAVGFDAARTNLRLAVELDKPDLPMSRAHWLVGAYELATSNYAAATEHFQKAVELARRANEKGDELLVVGYVRLTALLRTPDDADAKAKMDAAKAALSELKDGKFFVGQLDTALRVFSSRD